MTESITEYLSADHRRLDGILDAVVTRASAQDKTGAIEEFRRFRGGLERHIEIEERLLFPAFEERSGMRSGPTMVMRSEHVAIREAMQIISDQLANGALDLAATTISELAAVLSGHNMKEERVLYPMSDRIAAGDAPELVRRMVEYQETR